MHLTPLPDPTITTMRPTWVLGFLDAMRATGNVAASCRAVGVSSSTAYHLRSTDADFACEWDNALEDATDTLELEARRRAVEGIEEPVIYQGQPTPVWERDEAGNVVMEAYDTGLEKDGKPVMGSRPRQLVVDGKPQFLTVNKKSDSLLMFMLKGLRKKYGTETTELTGANGGPVAVVDSAARAARVAALMELARGRKAASSTEDLA